jgi:hypothetical protein
VDIFATEQNSGTSSSHETSISNIQISNILLHLREATLVDNEELLARLAANVMLASRETTPSYLCSESHSPSFHSAESQSSSELLELTSLATRCVVSIDA